jgi:hypothetical protein
MILVMRACFRLRLDPSLISADEIAVPTCDQGSNASFAYLAPIANTSGPTCCVTTSPIRV